MFSVLWLFFGAICNRRSILGGRSIAACMQSHAIWTGLKRKNSVGTMRWGDQKRDGEHAVITKPASHQRLCPPYTSGGYRTLTGGGLWTPANVPQQWWFQKPPLEGTQQWREIVVVRPIVSKVDFEPPLVGYSVTKVDYFPVMAMLSVCC